MKNKTYILFSSLFSVRNNMIVCVIIVALVCALRFILSFRGYSESTSYLTCQSNFYSIAVAMREYRELHGHFPPAHLLGSDGEPAHSWRVLLLDTLDAKLFKEYRFDESWDGPNNRKLAEKMPSCFGCPNDPGKKKWETSYFVMIGEDTVFPGATSVKLSQIRRPHAKTILIIEARNQGIHWMAPKDLFFNELNNDQSKPRNQSRFNNHSRGTVAYTVDGRFICVTEDSLPEFRNYFLISDKN